MVNWKNLVDKNTGTVKNFALGKLSGRSFYGRFAGTEVGGEVRQLLRENGVKYARRLARKALRRRNLLQ